MLIGEIKEASTIDYPGELVSVLFLCHCSFRCPFCQNWSLVRGEDCTEVSVVDIVKQLERNRKYISGLCITGGEPTVQIEGLVELLKNTHKMGLLNKLDTNGYYPERLKRLLSLNLLDYIAMDLKAPLISKRYGEVIGKPEIGQEAVNKILETLQILEKSSIPFEIRTTIIPNFNDTDQEIEQIVKKLAEFKIPRYVLQQFRSSGGTLDEKFSKLPATDPDLLLKLGKIAKQYIPDVRTRTIEAGEKKI